MTLLAEIEMLLILNSILCPKFVTFLAILQDHCIIDPVVLEKKILRFVTSYWLAAIFVIRPRFYL